MSSDAGPAIIGDLEMEFNDGDDAEMDEDQDENDDMDEEHDEDDEHDENGLEPRGRP